MQFLWQMETNKSAFCNVLQGSGFSAIIITLHNCLQRFLSNLGLIKNNFYMNPPLDSFYAEKLFTVFLFVWKEFFCGSFNFFVAKLSSI